MRGNLLAAGVPHACKALASVHRAAKAASAAAAWRPRAARCAGGRGAASSHHLTGCRRPWDQGCDYPEPCDVSGVQKPSDRWSSAALAKAVGFRCQAAICLKAPLLQPAPGLGPKRRPYISTFCLATKLEKENTERLVLTLSWVLQSSLLPLLGPNGGGGVGQSRACPPKTPRSRRYRRE